MDVSQIYSNLNDNPSDYQMKEIIISMFICNNKHVHVSHMRKAYVHDCALKSLSKHECWWVDIFASFFREHFSVFSIGNLKLINADYRKC